MEGHIHEEAGPRESGGGGPLVLTEAAIQQFRSVMKKESVPVDHGVRISVSSGGCSGMSYALNFDNAAREGDTVSEQGGLKVYVDRESAPFLDGVTVDYVVGLHREGFKFVNPKAARTCGCGESFGV